MSTKGDVDYFVERMYGYRMEKLGLSFVLEMEVEMLIS